MPILTLDVGAGRRRAHRIIRRFSCSARSAALRTGLRSSHLGLRGTFIVARSCESAVGLTGLESSFLSDRHGTGLPGVFRFEDLIAVMSVHRPHLRMRDDHRQPVLPGRRPAPYAFDCLLLAADPLLSCCHSSHVSAYSALRIKSNEWLLVSRSPSYFRKMTVRVSHLT